jgi:hypothetical protein
VARYATRSRGALTPWALAQLCHAFGVIMIMYKASTPSLGGKHNAFLSTSLIRLGSQRGVRNRIIWRGIR